MAAQPICGAVHPNLLSKGHLIICLREPGHPFRPPGVVVLDDNRFVTHEGRSQHVLGLYRW